ncbi:Phytosulfokine precursor protein (PSK) [Musa troglodytarum]|uniref:Phytosulfokine n=1 Tax=Musa troglodytarum TaxID=320322 RepID=A0A9E7FVF7_9LILI|nr:Phytosulfokine precursor protein (PSK) [Musa troglodytarum]
MSRKVTVAIVALLLFLSLAHAGRPEPADLEKANVQGVEGEESDKAVQGCGGKEECLKRSTLTAHTDYIYTQGGETSEKVEAGCAGLGKEKCLEKSTLTAHTDYIYTQRHH